MRFGSDSVATVNDLERELAGVVAEFEPPSMATQAAYQRDLARLFAGVTAIKRKSTYYRYRAALCWYFRSSALQLLQKLQTLDEGGEQKVPESVLAQVEVLSNGLSMLEPGSDCIADNLEFGRRCTFEAQASATSKRDGLRWLPEDWREQMLSANLADPERWTALSILFLSGLRPAEFEHGVEVSLNIPGDLLQIWIVGAKVREGCGQSWRALSFEVKKSGAVVRLRDALGLKPGGKPTRVTYPKNKLRALMRLTGARLFKDMPLLPSPVTARHQLAADMKRMHCPQVTIAEALGHRSITTQEHYGYKRFGRRGAVLPKHVSAAIAVDSLYLPHIAVGNGTNAVAHSPGRAALQSSRAAALAGF